MEYVEAIKKRSYILQMKEYLKEHSLRDYLFFVMGINMGLRISELLQLKVEDMKEDEKIKEFFLTDDHTTIYINHQVKQAISLYLHHRPLSSSDYLFKSKKCKTPITRQQAYRIINKAAKEIGVPGKIGTHTLRKTFGYHAYSSGVAVSLLQKHFRHATPSETLRYLGVKKRDDTPVKIDVNL
ncbi:site-specific tyrosine recombinase XerC [Bacillus sp. THAF10]|uniref:tyrosine-type recombinase/integrase n=1 Tax=Bacillus sp. THAF10 TaxID=2587848 RepID=UPI001267F016|nr:tyrosine-type recombinase/integrase [Bacillus sp. THAF10]QFT88191.1 site-specific tyrosine recombinase XerC [Bacillus sp. THAF10]